MTEAIVVFEQVVKKFTGKVALKGASFSLPRGKVIGVIGTNGSGKSTLLKLMAGLQYPNKGQVLINGREAERLSSRHIAFLPEQDVFYPTYSIEQTIRFYNEIYSDFDRNKALEIVRFLNLVLEHKVSDLSKGNRARLKIVLALSRQVPLLVMDEPLSGLDPIVRETIIRSLISYIDMDEQTVVMTTHEVDEIEPLLDIAMMIHDGALLGFEEVEQIRGKYGINLVDWMKKLIEEKGI